MSARKDYFDEIEMFGIYETGDTISKYFNNIKTKFLK